MSTLEVGRIAPVGGTLQIDGRVVFTQPIPGINYAPVNDIGTPGGQGFGVGIAPQDYAGFSPLSGTFDPASAQYGNYKYTDGSIMCWIPAFWYKVGTGSNGLPVNKIDVRRFSQYASVADAAAAGYALPRAFYEGGQIKAGLFMDKYHAANNNGVASSIQFLSPLSTSSARNPIGALSGAPANNYGGVLAAAKTRGNIFHACTIFQHTILAILAKAHGDASLSTALNAWYAPGANFPKGNNNNANYNDANDSLVTFQRTSDADFNAGFYSSLNGSASVLAKTTHNGQSCGVADCNGNVWDVTPGFTTDGTNFYIAGPSVKQNDLTSANAFGAPAGWTNVGPSLGAAGGINTVLFGNGANQVLEEETSGNLWLATSAGIPTSAGVSGGGTTEFGNDGLFRTGTGIGSPANLAPIRGGSWVNGGNAGVVALNLADSSGVASANVGFRACSFGSL